MVSTRRTIKREQKAVGTEAANTIRRRAAAWRVAATKKPPAGAAAADIQVGPAEIPATAPKVPPTTEEKAFLFHIGVSRAWRKQ
jgi:hypothetical protein